MVQGEVFTAREMKTLKKKEAADKEALVEEVEEEDVETHRPKVLQQWPVPDEHFLRVGDCVRIVPKSKRPGALAMGVEPYKDPYSADDEVL